MTELELTRAREDRRLYSLEGVGTLRLVGWTARSAMAQAGGHSWQISGRGVWRRLIAATDGAGAVAGEFKPSRMRRGGELQWGGRDLLLRPASVWRERYALAEGDRELALFDGRGWGRHPVKVTVDDAGALDPGLLLFAVFVVRGLAEESASSAAAGSSAATAG